MVRLRMNATTLRLMILSFLEFAVWGAYLTSMGIYLFKVGVGENLGWFFSVQGIASIFMPAIVGVIVYGVLLIILRTEEANDILTIIKNIKKVK